MASDQSPSSSSARNSSSNNNNNNNNNNKQPGTSNSSSNNNNGYKRASRKGAPRRFSCQYAGCDKIYSRAEHLQRHQLNHNPREIYHCDVSGCDQKFVRLDLLDRHKKRHKDSYTPRNRVPSFAAPNEGSSNQQPLSDDGLRPVYPLKQEHQQQHHGSAGPHDAAILLTQDPEDAAATATASFAMMGHDRSVHAHQPWSIPLAERPVDRHTPPKENYYDTTAVSLPDASGMHTFPQVPFPSDDQFLQGNFAAWLFDPQTSYNELSVSSMPFFEGGLESTFNIDIHYDQESHQSRSPMDSILHRYGESPTGDLLDEARRQEVLSLFRLFCKKQPSYEARMPNLLRESGGDLVALSLDMMRECLAEFWESVAPRLPIVHQHTFSPNRCPIFLLCVIIALGAASAQRRDGTGQLAEWGPFADVIIFIVRWEIVTCDDSAPPASLWVTQALLLIEFYEKLYSTRRFHERAHIYHPSFLTLLRRGSPLIGRTGSESPPESDHLSTERTGPHGLTVDSQTWWVRWAETESMHRVVFAAFMLDVIHASMFGHSADMAAHEIRLPLPCDDQLWTATSPDTVRQLDANFRMYGVKQVSFLDGLKSALHCKEVKTHSFGRMIILAGLLNVAWHLNHRETHMKWLELRMPPSETQDGWRKMLLHAFDSWKGSFDGTISRTMASSDLSSSSSTSGGHHHHQQPLVLNGPIKSASVLFHLAHISLHADIVDCQVYAGAKRILGRKVSMRDYNNAVKRMSKWARLDSTRHAVVHAFKLLETVLVEPAVRRRTGTRGGAGAAREPAVVQYSVRSDPDPHGPWIMYYATLTIWAYVHAVCHPLPLSAGKKYTGNAASSHHHSSAPVSSGGSVGLSSSSVYTRTAGYLTEAVRMPLLSEESAAAVAHNGVLDLLDVMITLLGEAEPELLTEARERLKACKEMLLASRQGSTWQMKEETSRLA
jgi:hypothetical protein